MPCIHQECCPSNRWRSPCGIMGHQTTAADGHRDCGRRSGMDTTPRKGTLAVPLLVVLLLLVIAASPLLLDAAMCALDTRAFTLAPGVVIYRSDVDLDSGVGQALQRHETVHQQQMREYGLLRFWTFYICGSLHLPGQYPRLEEEAREAETEAWLACRHIDFGSKPPWSTDEGGLPWLDRKEADA